MDNTRSLTLIAPGVAHALFRASQKGESRWPELARLAGRGSVSLIGGDDAFGPESWQIALLEAVGLGKSMTQYPQAAVASVGCGGEPSADTWVLATPMHFVAGLNDLKAMLLEGEQAVTAAERAELSSILGPHVLAAGFEMSLKSERPWLLRSQQALEVATAPPAAAVNQDLSRFMPRGRDASVLKRLMTELQMLLHEHPVNLARARRGAPAVNAVWFHGVGAIGAVHRRELPDAFGDDAYLRGLYRLHAQALVARATDAEAVLARMGERAVVLSDVSSLDELEQQWLAPLSRALRSGALATLNLALDRWRVSVERSALLKFWRGARAPAQWVVQ